MAPQLDLQLSTAATEAILQEALKGRRLVFEIGIDERFREQLSAVWRRALHESRGIFTTAARQCPALVATIVAVDSVFAYHAGELWGRGSLGEAPGTVIGQAFTSALGRLGLETFPVFDEQGAARYVSRILAHGGVPVYCLGDLFRLVLQARSNGIDDAFEVVEALHDGSSFGLHIDRPVRRFLSNTGAIGRDFLQRVLELPEAAEEAEGSDVIARRLGLPAYVVTEFRRLLPSLDAPSALAFRLPRPRLVLDPELGDGPELVLPWTRGAIQSWLIMHEPALSSHGELVSASDYGESRVSVAPATRWRVSGRGHGEELLLASSVGGLTDARPILAFDKEDHTVLSDARFAPRRDVLVLAPCQLTAPSGGVLVNDSYPIAAKAWAGWLVHDVTIDGSGVLEGDLQLQRIQVRLGTDDPVNVSFTNNCPNVSTLDGREVFGGPPILSSVPWSANDVDRWKVSLSSTGTGTHTFAPSDDLATVNERIARLVGTRLVPDLTLRLLGPVGGSYRLLAAVVPALEVQLPDRVLLPGDKASVTISVAPGLRVGADDHVARMEVNAVSPHVVAYVFDDEGRDVGLTFRCVAVRWRVITGAGTAEPFATKEVRRTFHPEGTTRAVLALDLGTRIEDARVVIVEERGESPCAPTGPVGATQLRYDLSSVVQRVLREESLAFSVDLKVGERRCRLASFEEAITVSLLSIEYALDEGEPVLKYVVEQSRAMPGRVLMIKSPDRPWARSIGVPLIEPSDEGSVGCSRLRPGRYEALLVLSDGEADYRVPEGSRPLTFDIPWTAQPIDTANIEDERELLVEAIAQRSAVAPKLRDPVAAAPAAALLVGANHCESSGADAVFGAVRCSFAEWLNALAYAEEHYGLTASTRVRASVRILARTLPDRLAIGEVRGVGTRLLRLTQIALSPAGGDEELASLTGILNDEALSTEGVLGSSARPVGFKQLQAAVRELGRLPSGPLTANGRAYGVIAVRAWGKSPDEWQRKWVSELANAYRLPAAELLYLPEPIARACRQARAWVRESTHPDGPAVAELHVRSFEAAAHLAYATARRRDAAEFLASVAKTFPEYVETRLAFFLREEALARYRL